MKHLLPTQAEQTIKILPRVYTTSIVLLLRDDSTNEITTASVNTVTDKDYLTLSYAFNLKEGRYYDLTLLNGSDVIYLDRVFCTDQTINQDTNDYYSVNKNQYVTKDGNNDYIVL